MSEFKFKTYRCEWQVQFHNVDQYGQTQNIYERFSFPTQEEAYEYRSTVATKNPYNSIWKPNNAKHDYCEAIVSYNEVEVK